MRRKHGAGKYAAEICGITIKDGSISMHSLFHFRTPERHIAMQVDLAKTARTQAKIPANASSVHLFHAARKKMMERKA
jgi:hypothetical protein